MGKSYKIVLNSHIAGGNLMHFQQFFYDWDKLEQGSYKCSFTFIAGINGNPDNLYVPTVAIDLGQSNVYFAKGTNTLETPSIPNFIGYLNSNVILYNLIDPIQNNAYLYANLETNPSIYLQQRPTNNTFSVRIQVNNNPTFNYNTNLIGKYTLTLYLEKMD